MINKKKVKASSIRQTGTYLLNVPSHGRRIPDPQFRLLSNVGGNYRTSFPLPYPAPESKAFNLFPSLESSLLFFRSASHLICLFFFILCRICNQTLQILESLLASKDVKSLIETRSILKSLLRSEALFVLREIAEKSIDSTIPVVEFFINAFALVGDVESCLALKYEVLVLRELKYMNHHSLQVSHEEWLTFADDSLNNGFYSIAVKGYENALLCIQRTKLVEDIFKEVQVVGKIKERRDMARTLVASQSVQAQTARYLKRKCVPESRKNDSCSMGATFLASSLFRSGIKKRNIQKLRQCQSQQKNING